MQWFIISFVAVVAGLLTVSLGVFLLRSTLLNWAVDRALVRLLKDPYPENLWDIVIGMTRIPPQALMELELRADFGETLERPLGSTRRLPDFSGVAFNPAQLVRAPLAPEAPVDLSVVLCPRSNKPLRLKFPIMVGAMGYGVAFSKLFVRALARGASQAGTAYNAGYGPVLPEIRRDTRNLILQYAGGAWSRQPSVLAQADMLEIRYGHGGRAAIGRVIPATELPSEAQELMGIPEDGQAVIEAPLPGAATPAELRKLVPELRPTVHALHRAVRFLEHSGVRRDISLIISGGLRTPGEILKALALGADAVYLGTAAMMAGTHGQISKSVPLRLPPSWRPLPAGAQRARAYRGARTSPKEGASGNG